MKQVLTAATHPGALPKCSTCNGLGWHPGIQGASVVAERCHCVQRCPLCGDTGWIRVGDSPTAPRARCRCATNQRWMDAFTQIGVPRRHIHSTLETYQPGANTAVFQRVYRYIDQWKRGEENRGFVLTGEVGRGKTHLMCATLRALLIHHGVRSRFVEFSHIVSELKSGFSQGRSVLELLGPLVEVEVLAIDELGKGRFTDFERSVIDELVSRRYNAGKTILATTNFRNGPPSGVNEPINNLATPQTIGDRVGDRVYSRLIEVCDFWRLGGEDWRAIHRGQTQPRRP